MTRPDPKYTEQELRLILQRAVEMERLGPSLDGVGGSLTFSELNEIAEEVGIDPRVIAAVSLAAPAGLLGAPLLAAAAVGGVVGLTMGRGIWHLMAQESKRATRRLASSLAASAGEFAETEPTR